jgi:hypothetical protein
MRAFFVQNFGSKNYKAAQSAFLQNFGTKNTLSDKKRACKMLMKLTLGRYIQCFFYPHYLAISITYVADCLSPRVSFEKRDSEYLTRFLTNG